MYVRCIYFLKLTTQLKHTTMNNFKQDLIAGKEVEQWFALLLAKAGHTNIEFNNSTDVSELIKWDIQCTQGKAGRTVRFEIKWDKKSTTTGNLALEFWGRSKPSGIDATTADYFVFLTNNEFFIFETKVLKNLVKNMNFTNLCINNGTAYCYLMPKEQVRQFAKAVLINPASNE